ncbi:MAG: NAD(P)-binding domain-containing protein [Ignavibacteriaceae bacterium]|nr:NAD(P)-binding domain-containing protein [Ignavibacteriaceae bacterium]
MKKTIAVIGAAGNMGSGITTNLAKAGYRVLIAGNDQSKLSSLLTKIKSNTPNADVEIIDCSKEASWEADIIIPAISYQAQAAVASKIKDVVTGKIVISLANPLNDTYDGLLTGATTSAAEELAKLLPNSKVVKAFNTVFAADFNTPKLGGNTFDVFVAGDDEEAVSEVSEIVKDAGFNPLAAGKLAVSRTLENMMLMLIGLSMKNNYNWLAGWKVLHNA